VTGWVELADGEVRVSKKLMYGKSRGVKAIAVRSISSVTIKPAGLLSGYIHFAFSGGSDSKGGVFDATKDENAVVFVKKQQPAFVAIRDEIRRLQAAADSSPAAAPASAAQQVRELAALRDDGLLSPEEFETKRRELLGL